MRSKLAQNLKVVVAQRLVKRKPKGRVAVCEVMRVSALVSEMIMDPLKTHEIEELLKGEEAIEGMLHFDEHLRELAEAGVITNEVALENATSRNDLELKLKGLIKSNGKLNFSMKLMCFLIVSLETPKISVFAF